MTAVAYQASGKPAGNTRLLGTQSIKIRLDKPILPRLRTKPLRHAGTRRSSGTDVGLNGPIVGGLLAICASAVTKLQEAACYLAQLLGPDPPNQRFGSLSVPDSAVSPQIVMGCATQIRSSWLPNLPLDPTSVPAPASLQAVRACLVQQTRAKGALGSAVLE